MAYDAWGEGGPLVLVPGLGCDGRMWGGVLDRLGADYRVIVPRIWEASSIAEAAEFAAEAIKMEEVGPALLAGLSMGGYVVFETLRRYPKLVKAAALLDTTAYPDDAHRLEKRLQVLRLLAEGKFWEVKEAFVRSVLWTESPDYPRNAEFLLRLCDDVGAKGYARSLAAIKDRGSYEDVLETAEVPLLFLAGAHDKLTPPALAARMAAEAKNAQAYEIPDAAHMSAVENPGAVASALGQFFGRFAGDQDMLRRPG